MVWHCVDRSAEGASGNHQDTDATTFTPSAVGEALLTFDDSEVVRRGLDAMKTWFTVFEHTMGLPRDYEALRNRKKCKVHRGELPDSSSETVKAASQWLEASLLGLQDRMHIGTVVCICPPNVTTALL